MTDEQRVMEHRLAFPNVDGLSIILGEDDDGTAAVHIEVPQAYHYDNALKRMVRIIVNDREVYRHLAYAPVEQPDEHQTYVDEGDAYVINPSERTETTNQEQDMMMSETMTSPRTADQSESLSSTEVIRRLQGRLTYRQLDYWVRVGRIRPSIRDGSGPGGPNQRQWSPRDVEALDSILNMMERHESEEQRLSSGELWAALHRGIRAMATSGDGHGDGDGDGG